MSCQKILNLFCDKLKEFLTSNNLLSKLQSGFRKKHSTITAATRVINDILVALDKQRYCASLIDLSKAFDTVEHAVLRHWLLCLGLSDHVVSWFTNYLSDRTQCLNLCVHKGMLLGKNVLDGNMHFYADDTIIYSFGSTHAKAVESLQKKAFYVVQHTLLQLKLFLNTEKTKLVFRH